MIDYRYGTRYVLYRYCTAFLVEQKQVGWLSCGMFLFSTWRKIKIWSCSTYLGTGLSSGPTGVTGAPQATADQGELLPTWLVGWKGGPAGAGTACRVRKACEAWSAFVREICEGDAKQLTTARRGI